MRKKVAGTPAVRKVDRIDGTASAFAPASKVSATTWRVVGMRSQSIPASRAGIAGVGEEGLGAGAGGVVRAGGGGGGVGGTGCAPLLRGPGVNGLVGAPGVRGVPGAVRAVLGAGVGVGAGALGDAVGRLVPQPAMSARAAAARAIRRNLGTGRDLGRGRDPGTTNVDMTDTTDMTNTWVLHCLDAFSAPPLR